MRAARTGALLDTLLQDLRYGLRTLTKNPTFAAAAIVTLGLGIGANTAIFSVVNRVLLSPLAGRDPDRLVWLWESMPDAALMAAADGNRLGTPDEIAAAARRLLDDPRADATLADFVTQ